MPVQQFILDRKAELADLCRGTGVRRLDIFGSAVRDDFSVADSDLDFLVEFEPMLPAEYATAYLDLKEALEHLFGRQIDLVTVASVSNPYLHARIEQERQIIFQMTD